MDSTSRRRVVIIGAGIALAAALAAAAATHDVDIVLADAATLDDMAPEKEPFDILQLAPPLAIEVEPRWWKSDWAWETDPAMFTWLEDDPAPRAPWYWLVSGPYLSILARTALPHILGMCQANAFSAERLDRLKKLSCVVEIT